VSAVLPSELDPELSADRLQLIAQQMLDVLHGALADTQTEDDCAYTRGSLVWGRIRNSLIRLIRTRRHRWLTVRHSGNDLVIGIGPHAARFFVDDHLRPRKLRVFLPTEGEAQQLLLNLPGVGDRDVVLWRFFIEKARTEQEEHRVYFVGYNAAQETVASWCYTEGVRAFVASDSYIPAPVVLDPIELEPLEDANHQDDAHESRRP
jgi:hypothetical protein